MTKDDADALDALLVIYNPVCGHGDGQALFEGTVLPMLRDAGRIPDKIVATTHSGHAGEVVVEFLQQTTGPVSIVLGSGDGTLHEILCALHAAAVPQADRHITFALVPCGTANALFSSLFPITPAEDEQLKASKTHSLRALLSSKPKSGQSRPLRLAKTSFLAARDIAPTLSTPSSVAAVVTSTSFHAGILHDSESLRASNPGIERFKIAAQMNATKWYHARANLFTVMSAVEGSHLIPCVEIFDPAKGYFVPYHGPGRSEDGRTVTLDGPFTYFLSTVNVDRLEPAFRITPSQVTFPPSPVTAPAMMDVAVIRPLRDPSVNAESDVAREQFAQKTMAVMGGAYRDGAHIQMRYGPQGEIVEGEGQGDTVVEYFRCYGWEWLPVGPHCSLQMM